MIAEAALQLEEAVSEARELGIRVDFVDDLTRDLTGRVRPGDAARCVVGRLLDDGVFVVRLSAEQEPDAALSALQVAIRRILAFDRVPWFVSAEDGVAEAFVYLCDAGGVPMELLPDVRRLMAS